MKTTVVKVITVCVFTSLITFYVIYSSGGFSEKSNSLFSDPNGDNVNLSNTLPEQETDSVQQPNTTKPIPSFPKSDDEQTIMSSSKSMVIEPFDVKAPKLPKETKMMDSTSYFHHMSSSKVRVIPWEEYKKAFETKEDSIKEDK